MNHELGELLEEVSETKKEVAIIKTDISWLKKNFTWLLVAIGGVLFGVIAEFLHRILF